jgi:hypothetical protein
LPKHWNTPADTLSEVDFAQLADAEVYVDAIIRRLDRKPIR